MLLNKLITRLSICIFCLSVSACTDAELLKHLPQKEDERTLADIFKQSEIYLALHLSNLQSAGGSSRQSVNSVPNPIFGKETYNEQAYVDGLLLLFSGNDKATAQLVSVSSLANAPSVFSEHEGITTEHILIQRLNANALPSSGNLYALVLLNAYNCFATTNVTNLTLVGDTSGTNLIGKTFSQLDAYFAAHFSVDTDAKAFTTRDNKPYFMMSSAPSVISGNTQILVEVTREHLFPTPTEARQDTQPLTMYVQRLVSKVTIATADNDLKARIKGIFLDNTNKTSFLTQHIDPTWNALPFYYNDGIQGRYRFAIDPNYNYGEWRAPTEIYETEDSIVKQFNRRENIPTILAPLGSPIYSAENTFNLNGMRDNFTTRLVIAYQWAPTDFYSIGSLDETHAYTQSEMMTILKQAILDNHKFKEGQANVNAINKSADAHWVYQTATLSDIEIAVTENAGKVRITNITLSPAGVDKFNAGPELIIKHEDGSREYYADHIMTDVNANTQVTYYKGGICYYPIYIRHFTDQEGKSWILSSPYYQASHLGRYGMVRNHWYVVNLQYKTGNIPQQIGFPTLPPYNNSFDDTASPYFDATFTVDSWVGRTYEHEFNQ